MILLEIRHQTSPYSSSPPGVNKNYVFLPYLQDRTVRSFHYIDLSTDTFCRIHHCSWHDKYRYYSTSLLLQLFINTHLLLRVHNIEFFIAGNHTGSKLTSVTDFMYSSRTFYVVTTITPAIARAP